MTGAFEDLLAANKRYARSFPHGFDGIAQEGVLILTCMDSRLEPLEMVGLMLGEAKILRTPGARLTPDALAGCVMGVFMLNVSRILIVPHTLCAAASADNAGMRQRILASRGVDVGDFDFGVSPHQLDNLEADVSTIRTHELIGGRVEVGGFLYDVNTGLIRQIV